MSHTAATMPTTKATTARPNNHGFMRASASSSLVWLLKRFAGRLYFTPKA
jgi:hypothetical protein